MTQAQIKQLHTILAKIETLQHKVATETAVYHLGAAKSELLRLLRDVSPTGA